MPLHVPQPPSAAQRSVSAALEAPSHAGTHRTPALVRRAQGPLRCGLALPVHELENLERLENRGGPRGAEEFTPPHTQPVGWRFLLHDTTAPEGSCAGTVEAVHTPDGWAPVRYCEGPYVNSTARALRQAEGLPQPYQPRLLSLPELYMLTLWLHEDVTADAATGRPTPPDLLIPLAPAPPGVAAHQPHRVETLLPRLVRRLTPRPSRLLGTPA